MSFKNIDDYIQTFPAEVQTRLQKIRELIQKSAPNAVEAISYQMPTFKLNGKNLVHFAGYAHHIGFYPTPHGITAFDKELLKYKHAKGSAQFQLNEEIPYDLIEQIVKFRVKSLTEKSKIVK